MAGCGMRVKGAPPCRTLAVSRFHMLAIGACAGELRCLAPDGVQNPPTRSQTRDPGGRRTEAAATRTPALHVSGCSGKCPWAKRRNATLQLQELNKKSKSMLQTSVRELCKSSRLKRFIEKYYTSLPSNACCCGPGPACRACPRICMCCARICICCCRRAFRLITHSR